MDEQAIDGSGLPEGVLCLTFDDGPGASASSGPGPKTYELGQFLADRGIPGAFFMCGKHVRELPEVPDLLRALGHVVGNHTENHRHASELTLEQLAAEIASTHEILSAASSDPVYFRAPYGDWAPEHVTALRSAFPDLAANHRGHVHWTVDVQDWSFWRDDRSPQECAQAYLSEIEEERRGVVLMHDCTADDETIKSKNRAYEVVQILVPELERRGYSFVSLPEVGLG